MTKSFNTPQHNHSAEDLRREQEALWEALNSCDKDTYQSVISLLRAAGSLHE